MSVVWREFSDGDHVSDNLDRSSLTLEKSKPPLFSLSLDLTFLWKIPSLGDGIFSKIPFGEGEFFWKMSPFLKPPFWGEGFR